MEQPKYIQYTHQIGSKHFSDSFYSTAVKVIYVQQVININIKNWGQTVMLADLLFRKYYLLKAEIIIKF